MPIDPLPPADAKAAPRVAVGNETATNAGAPISGGSREAVGATALLPSSVVSPGLDRADIQPLNVPTALGILVGEARTALGLPPLNSPIQSPAQAAIGLVQIFLASLPPMLAEPLDPEAPRDVTLPLDVTLTLHAEAAPPEMVDTAVAVAWNGALVLLRARLGASMEQAAATVSTWRDADPVVIHAVNESRTMVLLAVGDAPLDGLFARPEWLWLAPRLEAFRRRRRAVRRRLEDPDYRTPSAADEWIPTGQ